MDRRGGAALSMVVLAAVVGLQRRWSGGEDAPPAAPARDRSVPIFWQRYEAAGRSRSEGRLEEALVQYEQALAIRPRHEDALYYRGNCAFDLGRFDEAIASYQALVDTNPLGSSRGHMQLGLTYASLDPRAPLDLERARRHFLQALEVDPDSGAVLALGEVALRARDWDEARARLQEAEASDPGGMAAPFLLGYLAWRDRREGEAWTAFRRAVSRGELKKPAVQWTQEGDLKADPALRWDAIARQTVTGRHWIRLRRYLAGSTRADMGSEYGRLHSALAGACAKRRVLR